MDRSNGSVARPTDNARSLRPIRGAVKDFVEWTERWAGWWNRCSTDASSDGVGDGGDDDDDDDDDDDWKMSN